MNGERTTLADAIDRAKKAQTPFCAICGAPALLVILDLESLKAASFCYLCLEIVVRVKR